MDGTSAIYFHDRVCGMPPDLYGGAEFCHAVQRIWCDLKIYAGQLQKYSGTGISEYICRIFETGVYQYDCDCTDRISVRVLHGKITGAPKKESAASVVHTILGKFTDPSVWLDHHPAEKRTFKFCIDKAWDH